MPVEKPFGPSDGKRLPCAPGAARTEYHEAASGLRLRVSATGARSWSVTYYSPKTKTGRRERLGNAATMPVKKARKLARATLHAVEAEGRDPAAERRKERDLELQARRERAEHRRAAAAARARKRMTFAELVERYIRFRATTPSGKYRRKARPNTLTMWESMLRRHVVPAIGDRPVESVAPGDILRVLEAAVANGGPVMGPRVLDFIAAAWKWAEPRSRDLGIVLPSPSPFASATLKEIGNEGSRSRVLSPKELWRLWRATEPEGPPGQALRFMLLSAARVREATLLPWSELDLRATLWTLPASRSKAARDRVVPLSAQALAALQVPKDGDLVFGRFETWPLMERVRARMKATAEKRGQAFEPFEARDLRRTAATLCGRLGADPFEVALVLDHARPDARMPAVTGVYLKTRYPERVREALDRLGAWVEQTVTSEKEPGDVVSFEARR